MMSWPLAKDLVGFFNHLPEKRGGLYLHQQGPNISISASRAMFQLLGV
jgi:hypothetical protein